MRLRWLFIPLFLSTALACAGGLSAAGGTTPFRLEPEQVRAYVLEVPADRGWGDTGLLLRSEETFRAAYLSGQAADGATVLADAAGSSYTCGHEYCCEPLPGAPRGALIGRVGREIFYLGNGGLFVSPANGPLQLRLNDCDEGLYDNRGSLQIVVIP